MSSGNAKVGLFDNETGVDVSVVEVGTRAGLATVMIDGLGIPSYDSIAATYPTTSSEVYTYKKGGSTVAVVTVSYTDNTKAVLTGVVRSV